MDGPERFSDQLRALWPAAKMFTAGRVGATLPTGPEFEGVRRLFDEFAAGRLMMRAVFGERIAEMHFLEAHRMIERGMVMMGAATGAPAEEHRLDFALKAMALLVEAGGKMGKVVANAGRFPDDARDYETRQAKRVGASKARRSTGERKRERARELRRETPTISLNRCSSIIADECGGNERTIRRTIRAVFVVEGASYEKAPGDCIAEPLSR